MDRLQGWAAWAQQQLPLAAGGGSQQKRQQQQLVGGGGGGGGEDEPDEVIYGRLAVYSDDEEGPHHHHQQQQQQEQHSQGGGGGMRPQRSHSETDLQELRAQAERLQDGPELIRLDSDDGQQAFEAAAVTAAAAADPFDWADFGAAGASAQAAGAAGDGASSSGLHIHPTSPAAAAAAAAAAVMSGGAPAAQQPRGGDAPPPGVPWFEAPSTTAAFETGEEVPDHDHTQQQRELLIYAIPLQRDKIIFLPVCPWRAPQPEAGSGWKRAVTGHVDRVQGEASDVWQKMAAAEQGSTINRLYKFGKRMLDSVPAEERLMRGVPKNVSKVIIHHPSQVSPDAIQGQMQTMTKSYGLKAVGRAAAATVMLPLAIGVDLIILPGPQVLSYYTSWMLWRNTNAAVGTGRMSKFITQSGSSANIRVNYVADPRLDRYHDAAAEVPEGVLTEDDIDGLVSDLREPDLHDALLSLRAKALSDAGRRTSRGGDEYTALPAADEGGAGAAAAFGSSASSSSRGGARPGSSGSRSSRW